MEAKQPKQDYEHPLEIRITTPSDEPRQSGVYSVKHPEASIQYFRINRFDTILLDRLCEELGIKPSTFCKQCVIKVMHELERLQNENKQPSKSR